MSVRPLLAAAAGSVAALALAAIVIGRRRFPERLLVTNHAGRRVPAVLGILLVASSLLSFGVAFPGAGSPLHLGDAAALGAVALLGLAGALDDASARGPRGIPAHVASLAGGRPTTGILKLVVGVGSGIVLAALLADGVVRVAAGAVLIAASVNLWNALDVRPGRALKWSLLVLLPVLAAVWDRTYALLGAGTAGAALALLAFDLRERGMLGDAGSNPLGLVVGLGLFLALPTGGVVAAALAAVLLQVLAETLTISRMIEATPPLRWLDRLGRS